MPVEFLGREVEYAFRDLTPGAAAPPRPDENSLDAAVGVIASARRPLVLAGRGARGARDALLRLAERADAAVAGDAAEVADTITSWLGEAGARTTTFRTTAMAKMAERTESAHDVRGITIQSALQVIDDIVPADRTFVTDAGRFLASAFGRIHVEGPDAYLFTVNFGAIGTGMASAIGAAYGRPGHPVLLVTGDGGFMLGGVSELSTAVRLGVDLVVVVCNDGSYGAEHIQLVTAGLAPDISTFDWPEFAPLARALGAEALAVRGAEDWAGVGELVENRTGPVLIDLKLDPNQMPDVTH